MEWSFQYTPYIWPMLASAVLMGSLGLYVWRRRAVPGALPLALAMLLAVPWAVGAALELAAAAEATKIAWFKFQAVWPAPAITAVLCFVVAYAGRERWLTRRTLTFLAIPPLLQWLLVVTNDAHHWIWRDLVWVGSDLHPVYGLGNWILTGYGYLLVALRVGILLWLVVRSPRQRWPASLMLGSQLLIAGAYLLDLTGRNPLAPLDPTILVLIVTSVIYTIVLFYFRLLDPVPVARAAVIEQMQEGMLVLDTGYRIVDLNPVAAKILGLPPVSARGHPVDQLLPWPSDLGAPSAPGEVAQSEISLGTGGAARHYALQRSPLADRTGTPIGFLVLLRDVTVRKRAQARFLEQQQELATQQERERLARELHDSLGQVLGYVSMQAQAIGKWLHDGQIETATAQIARLADVAQQAHADIRAAIAMLKDSSVAEQSFLAALRRDLAVFEDHYGIRIALTIPPEVEEQAFAPATGNQLRRVVQEALTNARQHGRASNIQVTLEIVGERLRIRIVDDGCGFDPDELPVDGGDHLGLTIMRERLASLGGSIELYSQPGAGTQVVFHVPLKQLNVEVR